VDASPRKAVVVPPLCEKRFSASGTGKAQTDIPDDNHKCHPRKGQHKGRSKRIEQAHRQHSNAEHDWDVANKREQRDISPLPVLTPRVVGRIHCDESSAGIAWLSKAGDYTSEPKENYFPHG
jgi:hypothetical protein